VAPRHSAAHDRPAHSVFLQMRFSVIELVGSSIRVLAVDQGIIVRKVQ
jgi:hypothetical protein